MKQRYVAVALALTMTLGYSIVSLGAYYMSLETGFYGVDLPLFGGGGDAMANWEDGIRIARGESTEVFSTYPVFLGALFALIGRESALAARIANLLGLLLLLLAVRAGVNLSWSFERPLCGEAPWTSMAIVLVCLTLYAGLVMNVSIGLVRDVWIYWLFVGAAVLGGRILFIRDAKATNIVLLLLVVYLLQGLRVYAAVSVIAALVIYRLFSMFKSRVSLLAVMGCLLVFAFVFYEYQIGLRLPVVNMSLRDALNYRDLAQGVHGGGSQMGITLAQDNVWLFALNYCHSFVGNMVGPLPWHITSVPTALAFFLEAMPMTIVLSRLWRLRHLLSAFHVYLITQAAVWIGLVALTNDNLGTGVRLRPPAWILLLVVFAVLEVKASGRRMLGTLTVAGGEAECEIPRRV
ncbi:MAG: hypothetical protein KGZ66_00345 [Selenomonadales bacterium]|nr:hypothetical protein [Selenomonadales bacterium]